MIDFTCSDCGRRVLVGPRAIEGLVNTGQGIVLKVKCPCGAYNRVVTGRESARRAGPEKLPEAPPGKATPEARSRAA